MLYAFMWRIRQWTQPISTPIGYRGEKVREVCEVAETTRSANKIIDAYDSFLTSVYVITCSCHRKVSEYVVILRR